MPFFSRLQHGRRETAVLCRDIEKNDMVSMAGARHDKCESDTAALCKSNGRDTLTLSGVAWQGNGMGTACYV